MSNENQTEVNNEKKEKDSTEETTELTASHYEMRPSLQNSFKTSSIKEIINLTLQEFLFGMLNQ